MTCPDEELLTDFLLDSETRESHPEIGRHIQECEICRERVKRENRLFDFLQKGTCSPPKSVPFFAAMLERHLSCACRYRWLTIAAIFLLATGALLVYNRTEFSASNTEEQRLVQSMEWLEKQQNQDGSWNAENGREEYSIGLSALAAMPFFLDDRENDFSTVKKNALNYFFSVQRKDGCFSPENSVEMYNHALTSMALSVAKVELSAEQKDSLQKGLEFMRETQTPEGGWGYLYGLPPNAPVTVWCVRSLLAAKRNGISDPDESIKKALQWLEDTAGREFQDYASPLHGKVQVTELSMMIASCLIEAEKLKVYHSKYPASTIHSKLTEELGKKDPYISAFFVLGEANLNFENLSQQLREKRMKEGDYKADSKWGRYIGKTGSTGLTLTGMLLSKKI